MMTRADFLRSIAGGLLMICGGALAAALEGRTVDPDDTIRMATMSGVSSGSLVTVHVGPGTPLEFPKPLHWFRPVVVS